MIFDALIKPLGDIIGQVLPDTKAKDKAMAELNLKRLEIEASMQEAITKENLGQIEINKIEAGSSNMFIAGARPAILWIGAIGLLYTFLLYPFMDWISVFFFPKIQPPVLQTDAILQLVFAMLGLGSLRTYEKIKGVNNIH
jgi:hypothetical protein